MQIEDFKRSALAILGDSLRLFRAPGRVNIIGEHTDYNDGFVLPAAIDRQVLIAVRGLPERKVTVHSLDFSETSAFSLDCIEHDHEHPWSNYIRGVCLVLEEAGYRLPGAEVVFAGDVPIGSGLSSSAALEVATATAFLSLVQRQIPGEQVARLCQQAENQFVGMRCGIMDQFASALGRAGHAILIDCCSLAYRPIPLPAGVRLIVSDTGVRRGLVSSEYNTRRWQCEEAVAILARALPNAASLRDVTLQQLQANRHLLPEVIYRRVRHVLTENERVLNAAKMMQTGDLPQLGHLLNLSHDSLRDDYEVSCSELDTMVAIARGQRGVYGSRMTGAGFGGCTISLVAEECAADFAGRVGPAYREATGLEPQVYICSAAAGAGEVAP